MGSSDASLCSAVSASAYPCQPLSVRSSDHPPASKEGLVSRLALYDLAGGDLT